MSEVQRRTYAFRILIVKCMRDELLLRALSDYVDISTIRFLRSCGIVDLFRQENPWLNRLLRRRTLIDEANSDDLSINAAIAHLAQREIEDWHAVLGDDTIVIRNEGEIRIIPKALALFSRYEDMLTVHGEKIGISEYFVQTGYDTELKGCSESEGH